MKASIDIGSNSVILLIGKFNKENNEFQQVKELVTITSLGKNLDKLGHFDEGSKSLTRKALYEYVNDVKLCGISPKDVIVTATEASRVATDSKDFFKEIYNNLGLKVSIINSRGEAYYTALGVLKGTNEAVIEGMNSKIIIDIGGASTEIIEAVSDPFAIEKSISLPIGSVRATDYARNQTYNQKIKTIKVEYPLEQYKSNRVICVAGNMTTLACIMLGLNEYSEMIHAKVFQLQEVRDIYSKLACMTVDEIKNQYPYIGKRAETIVGGTSVIITLSELLEIKEIEISIFGLRHGTLFEGYINEQYL